MDIIDKFFFVGLTATLLAFLSVCTFVCYDVFHGRIKYPVEYILIIIIGLLWVIMLFLSTVIGTTNISEKVGVYYDKEFGNTSENLQYAIDGESYENITMYPDFAKIAKEEDLVKIHHVSLDGTKIKAKTSMNKLTNEQQLKIMKQHLKESIELDEEEDMELGEESEMVFQKH